jgi:hypothetical protein
MKEIKFRVHTLHQQMQFVMSCLEMGQHGNALLACRAAVKELGDVDIQLAKIRRLPELVCASCLSLMSAQK